MSNATAVVIVDGFPVLNPFSWSAFLSPEVAHELEVLKYVLAGSSAVLIWDILNNIRNDCSLVAKYARLQLPTFVYFFSRLISLACVVFATIFQTAPISNCFHNGKALMVLIAIAIPSTTLIFFFRARAIFNFNPFAVTFFAVLWLGVLAGSMTAIPGLVASHIGPTPYCVIKSVHSYTLASAIAPLIYDIIVFFAISWRLWHNSWATRTMKNGIRAMVFGDYLPSFSKSLLQDGQVYFLTMVVFSILHLVVYARLAPTNPYRLMVAIPNIALINIMACRVHRWTVLPRGPGENESLSTFNPTALQVISLSRDGDFGSRTDSQMVNTASDSLKINVRNTVITSMV